MMLYIGKVYIDVISGLANGMGCNAGLASVFVDGCIPADLQTIVPYGRWDIEEAFSPTPLVDRMTMYTRTWVPSYLQSSTLTHKHLVCRAMKLLLWILSSAYFLKKSDPHDVLQMIQLFKR